MPSHYDPNQPRAPAGKRDGGQWSGGSHEQAILNSPLFDRGRLIRAALGIHGDDRREEKVRPALLDSHRPPAPIRLPPPIITSRVATGALRGLAVGAGDVLGPVGVVLGLGLFAWWSLSNDDKQQAIISFKANPYRRSDPDTPFVLDKLEGLTPDEVKASCGKNFTKVQDLTNKAYNELKASSEPLSPQNLGIKVHKAVETAVGTKGTFRAEPSFALIGDVKVNLNGEPDDGSRDATRGRKGTVRPDCYDWRNSRTACIYDIKTGAAGLGPRRVQDFLKALARKDRCIERVIVTEIRPNDPAVPTGE